MVEEKYIFYLVLAVCVCVCVCLFVFLRIIGFFGVFKIFLTVENSARITLIIMVGM